MIKDMNGNNIRLTKKLWKIFEILHIKIGTRVNLSFIKYHLYGNEPNRTSGALRQHIYLLRKCLINTKFYIVNVYANGYILKLKGQ